MFQNKEQALDTVLETIRGDIGNLKPGDKLCLVFEASAAEGNDPASFILQGFQAEQQQREFGPLEEELKALMQETLPELNSGSAQAPNYETEAARTDLDQDGYEDRAAKFYVGRNAEYCHGVNPAFHLLHALLGIVSEAGELADQLKRHIIYEQPLDRNNVLEEIGDIEWYLAKGARCMDSNLEEVRDANIAKLQKRFPEKFTNEQAVQRDTAAERQVLDDHFDEEETRG